MRQQWLVLSPFSAADFTLHVGNITITAHLGSAAGNLWPVRDFQKEKLLLRLTEFKRITHSLGSLENKIKS